MTKVLRKASATRYAEPRGNETQNDTKTSLRNDNQHRKIGEYAKLLKDQKKKKTEKSEKK